MRIIHSLVVTPGQCGLYETAKDLMVAEERLGCVPIALEPLGHSLGKSDDAIAIATPEQRSELLGSADVIVDHSGCDADMLASGVPIIHVRHGRPLSTFLMSMKGIDVYSHLAAIGKNYRYAAFVTFWRTHVAYWEPLLGREVHCLPPPVDLERFTPDGPRREYRAGFVNYVCGDMWREDSNPFELIHRFRTFPARAKLHLYGVKKASKPLETLLATLGDNRGEVGWAESMPHIYRGADWLITSADIETRAIREAMACGLKVWDQFCNMPPREYAERHFDSMATARGLIQIAERVAGVKV